MKGNSVLKCIIVDDEPLAHDIIIDYTAELSYLEIVSQAYRPIQAIDILSKSNIDLMFLDIQMPKINGLEMLSTLSNPPQIIITTAFEEFALKSYEFNVADYLLKPFRLDRFIKAVEKAKYNIANKNRNYVDDHSLLIKSDKRLIKVHMSDIHYIEGYGNYVKIWINQEYIITAKTLTNFRKVLPPRDFIQVHKSYIINKNNFIYIEGNSIKMKNGDSLTLSKTYKQIFMASLKTD